MARLYLYAYDKKAKIDRNIYGHFSEHLGRCIYNGFYVGEQSPIPNVNGIRSDVVAALRRINLPVLRWPGGCFADEYHWKDGIGPKASRKKMINTNWGGVVEDNSFGTHEFMELCSQIGCEPYITGNVGSGTIQEMSEWIEYLTFEGVSPMAQLRAANGRAAPWSLKFFGVGNENWGCGGTMRPEYYADLYRQYQTFLRGGGKDKLYRIACGANAEDYDWTETVMRIAGGQMDALALHYYTWTNGPQKKGSATEFTQQEYYRTLKKALRIEGLITRHLEIMNRYDPLHRVDMVVDEWGVWHTPEPGTNPRFLYQQSTMRDAIVASITLDIFGAHSDRIKMANLAQTVNVLQALILTEGEKLLLTPTYHVFDLYKNHQDATRIGHWLENSPLEVDDCEIPKLSATASEKDNAITLTITNLSATQPETIHCKLIDRPIASVSGRTLFGPMDAKNDFECQMLSIGLLEGIVKEGENVTVELPPCSVSEITFQLND